MSIVDMLIPAIAVICVIFIFYKIKEIFTTHKRKLPLMDVFEYKVIYKGQDEDGRAFNYYIDCVDKVNRNCKIQISKRQYNQIEKGEDILVIYKNGKISEIISK